MIVQNIYSLKYIGPEVWYSIFNFNLDLLNVHYSLHSQC